MKKNSKLPENCVVIDLDDPMLHRSGVAEIADVIAFALRYSAGQLRVASREDGENGIAFKLVPLTTSHQSPSVPTAKDQKKAKRGLPKVSTRFSEPPDFRAVETEG